MTFSLRDKRRSLCIGTGDRDFEGAVCNEDVGDKDRYLNQIYDSITV
ncbi:hypothetical protein [Myxosarcina sp. GI1]|nr:hypothetical protein [Myxosarcina sp. GI1]